MFPIGSINNLQLQLQTAALLPFSSYNSTALTTAGAMTVTLDQFALNMKYVDIGMESARLLHTTLNEGKIFIKTTTWMSSTSNIPAGSGGQLNLLYQIRNSSVKSLLIQNSVGNNASTGGISPNGLYDAVNLAVTQFNVSVGGISYPQRVIDVSRRPAEAFLHYLSALGFSGDYKKYGGYITRSGYGASTNIASVTQVDSSMVVSGAATNCNRAESSLAATAQVITQFPNTAFLGVDLEKSGGLLFNGVNTRSAPPLGNFYLNTGAVGAATSFCFGLVDCVLLVDTAANTIQAFV